jgi:hypothetical protein
MTISYGRCFTPQAGVSLQTARDNTDFLTFGLTLSNEYDLKFCKIFGHSGIAGHGGAPARIVMLAFEHGSFDL